MYKSHHLKVKPISFKLNWGRSISVWYKIEKTIWGAQSQYVGDDYPTCERLRWQRIWRLEDDPDDEGGMSEESGHLHPSAALKEFERVGEGRTCFWSTLLRDSEQFVESPPYMHCQYFSLKLRAVHHTLMCAPFPNLSIFWVAFFMQCIIVVQIFRCSANCALHCSAQMVLCRTGANIFVHCTQCK